METIISQQILYRGYTIEPDYRNPYSNEPEFMYYPTAQGIDHDADMDEDGYHYCGNCGWANSIEEAKDAIWEKIMMAKPKHIVIYGDPRERRSKEFEWLYEACRFRNMFDGILLPYGQPILNP